MSVPRVVFSENEKLTLVELVRRKKILLECSRTDAFCLRQKAAAWKALAGAFNLQPGMGRRTVEQLRTAWKNMKARAKKEVAEEKRDRMKTVGGPESKSISTISSKVMEILPAAKENSVDEDSYDEHNASQDLQLNVCEANTEFVSTGIDPPAANQSGLLASATSELTVTPELHVPGENSSQPSPSPPQCTGAQTSHSERQNPRKQRRVLLTAPQLKILQNEDDLHAQRSRLMEMKVTQEKELQQARLLQEKELHEARMLQEKELHEARLQEMEQKCQQVLELHTAALKEQQKDAIQRRRHRQELHEIRLLMARFAGSVRACKKK